MFVVNFELGRSSLDCQVLPDRTCIFLFRSVGHLKCFAKIKLQTLHIDGWPTYTCHYWLAAAEGSGDTQLHVRQYDLSPLITSVHKLTYVYLLDHYCFPDLSLSGIPTKYSCHFHPEPGCITIVLLDVVKVQWALLLFLLYISPVLQPSCESISWCFTYVFAFTSFTHHLVGYPFTPASPPSPSEHTIHFSASLHVFFLNGSVFCSLLLILKYQVREAVVIQ